MSHLGFNTLVAGELLSSDVDLTAVVMEDLFDSLLYPQRYADSRAKKFEAPVQWLSFYDNAMQVVKWGRPEHESRAFEPKDSASIVVETLVEEFMRPGLPEVQADAVKNMIACVAGLPEMDAVSELLRQQVLKLNVDGKGHSTIIVQVSALQKMTQLSSLSIVFTTTSAVGADPLRQVFPGNSIVGPVRVRFSRRIWSYAGYEGIREKVTGYLAGKKEGLILPILCKTSEESVDAG